MIILLHFSISAFIFMYICIPYDYIHSIYIDYHDCYYYPCFTSLMTSSNEVDDEMRSTSRAARIFPNFIHTHSIAHLDSMISRAIRISRYMDSHIIWLMSISFYTLNLLRECIHICIPDMVLMVRRPTDAAKVWSIAKETNNKS